MTTERKLWSWCGGKNKADLKDLTSFASSLKEISLRCLSIDAAFVKKKNTKTQKTRNMLLTLKTVAPHNTSARLEMRRVPNKRK